MFAPPLSDLVSDLVDRGDRQNVLARLARRHDAAGLLILVRDPETGHPRPAPGLARTLPDTPRWRDFLRHCRAPGERTVVVDALAGRPADLRLLAWTTPDGDTLAFLNPGPGCRPADVALLYRLPCALFRAELAVELATARVRVAETVVPRGEHLVQALGAARVAGACRTEDLADALEAAERANAALQDANTALDAARQVAERAASTDALTGVASRSAFERRLAMEVAAASAGGEPLSLLLIDLDGFKEINDTRGYAAGDAVLAAVGAQLTACRDADGMAGRLGGDEFALILPGQGPDAASFTADRVQGLIRAPVPFQGEDLAVRCTVGLASVPQDAVSAKDLLRRADLALYDAKRGNKGALGRYNAGAEGLFNERRRAVALLRCALDGGRIMVHYQPKVSLSDGRVVGFEALARLRTTDGALRGPAEFWAALSDQESVRLLGARMLDLVLADLASCRTLGVAQRPVAINVSGSEISTPGFADAMLAKLGALGVEAGLIEVEITETALLGDHPAKVRASLGRLRAAGMSVALDDFGTGYSSLSYLLDWDIDCIKIDRSFVGDFAPMSRSTRIVRSIVEMARGLDLKVVAEGVETAAQAEYLTSIGCPLAQGYLFGHAAPAGDTLLRPAT